jgi:hypothetical protein
MSSVNRVPSGGRRTTTADTVAGYVAIPAMWRRKTLDGATEPHWLAKQFLMSPKLPVRFDLEPGAFELDRYGKGGDILEPTRAFRDVLLAKGYDVHYQ